MLDPPSGQDGGRELSEITANQGPPEPDFATITPEDPITYRHADEER
jgi:hypothetical protein